MTKVYPCDTTSKIDLKRFPAEIKYLLLSELQQEYFKGRSGVSSYMTKVYEEN